MSATLDTWPVTLLPQMTVLWDLLGRVCLKICGIWDFGSIDDLSGANPKEMYERFSDIAGQRTDPCVEDVFSCAVAQAQDPELPDEMRQWWMWKEQRGLPQV
jgi:hypothetical protein